MSYHCKTLNSGKHIQIQPTSPPAPPQSAHTILSPWLFNEQLKCDMKPGEPPLLTRLLATP